jgi:carbamate kinase
MRLVVALGGNALIRRGEPPTAANQRKNVRIAVEALAPMAPGNQLVITHGNGPQVGLLALQAAAYEKVRPYPLDVLGAQTEGAIGYMIEQELGNLLPVERPFATVLTMVEVDPDDPAFGNPTKPIGPTYTEEEARALAEERGWSIAPDGDTWRRVVPSPLPKRVFEIRPIRWLLGHNVIVICSGGGGIPTMLDEEGKLHGVEAVIDKDRATAMLAEQVGAQFLVLATDADAVYLDWGTPNQRPIHETTPEVLRGLDLPVGSMGPKVEAACAFVERTGKPAAIGALADIAGMLEGNAGTQINPGS